MVPPSKACLYGIIYWSLTESWQVFHGLVSGGNARPKTELHFNVEKRHLPQFSDASLAKRPQWRVGCRKSTGGSVSASSTRGSHKGWHS